MAVGEPRLDRVAPDRLDAHDLDVALADLEHLLPRAVAAHLGRRAVDAQQFVRQLEPLAVGEGELHHPRLLVQPDLGGDGGVAIDHGGAAYAGAGRVLLHHDRHQRAGERSGVRRAAAGRVACGDHRVHAAAERHRRLGCDPRRATARGGPHRREHLAARRSWHGHRLGAGARRAARDQECARDRGTVRDRGSRARERRRRARRALPGAAPPPGGPAARSARRRRAL